MGEMNKAVEVIRSIVPDNLSKPVIGIVCGSGLGTLADELSDRFEIEYSSIPGFAQSGGEYIHFSMW